MSMTSLPLVWKDWLVGATADHAVHGPFHFDCFPNLLDLTCLPIQLDEAGSACPILDNGDQSPRWKSRGWRWRPLPLSKIVIALCYCSLGICVDHLFIYFTYETFIYFTTQWERTCLNERAQQCATVQVTLDSSQGWLECELYCNL